MTSGHELTFPLRVAYVFRSMEALKSLVTSDGRTSFTLWTAPGDLVIPSEVARFITAMGKDKCYLDVPEKLEREIRSLL